MAEQPSARQFTLLHPSEDFKKAEERDVLLSELALPLWFKGPLGSGFERIHGKILANKDQAYGKVVPLTKLYYESILSTEKPYFYDASLQDAIGVSLPDLKNFLRAMAAVALSWLTAAAEAARRATNTGRPRNREKWLGEMLEWTSPLVNANFLEGLLIAISGVSEQAAVKLLEFFTLDSEATLASDGFFPPFHYLKGENASRLVIFSPHVLLHMASQRNFLYAYFKNDSQGFDEKISADLEALLLDDIEAEFSRIEGMLIARNKVWKRSKVAGEFDLIIYDPSTNSVMHVQAKAPIPPQGARMVTRLEGRMREGLSQLEKFRTLPPGDQDAIISEIFSRTIEGADVHDVLAGRTSFGTAAVWSKLDNVTPVNPPLLRVAIDGIAATGSTFTIPALVTQLVALLDEMPESFSSSWRYETVAFRSGGSAGGIAVKLPLLDLDSKKIQKQHIKIFLSQD
ncbi:hypothetical protein [Actinoplanes rectilineatus]|uniref:hypothetical protein n=1 Tax=Actinoplanes rectilineatus TaxID=113571 RepID=UPI0012FBCB96|nr:hypothetical protein [Actinoplanes rectilineatus]